MISLPVGTPASVAVDSELSVSVNWTYERKQLPLGQPMLAH